MVTIYYLQNPKTKEVFYLGYTSDITRLYIDLFRQAIKNKTGRDTYILHLLACGDCPEIVVLEEGVSAKKINYWEKNVHVIETVRYRFEGEIKWEQFGLTYPF